MTNNKSATAKLIIKMFVVDLIMGLAATTGAKIIFKSIFAEASSGLPSSAKRGA
jgi:hypothetical protein